MLGEPGHGGAGTGEVESAAWSVVSPGQKLDLLSSAGTPLAGSGVAKLQPHSYFCQEFCSVFEILPT